MLNILVHFAPPDATHDSPFEIWRRLVQQVLESPQSVELELHVSRVQQLHKSRDSALINQCLDRRS